jgi:hypothetical protein
VSRKLVRTDEVGSFPYVRGVCCGERRERVRLAQAVETARDEDTIPSASVGLAHIRSFERAFT